MWSGIVHHKSDRKTRVLPTADHNNNHAYPILSQVTMLGSIQNDENSYPKLHWIDVNINKSNQTILYQGSNEQFCPIIYLMRWSKHYHTKHKKQSGELLYDCFLNGTIHSIMGLRWSLRVFPDCQDSFQKLWSEWMAWSGLDDLWWLFMSAQTIQTLA